MTEQAEGLLGSSAMIPLRGLYLHNQRLGLVRPNRRSHTQVMHPEMNAIASSGFAVLTATKVPFTFLYLATTTDGLVGYLTNSATGSAYPAVTAAPAGLTAIQCKYHEAKVDFTVSAIYKPLLQMMQHFSVNQKASISYVLFAHFPNPPANYKVSRADLQAALVTKNKKLRKYCKALNGGAILDKFLPKVSIQFGPTWDGMIESVHAALVAAGIPRGDVDTLAYPNAIQAIANLSIKHVAVVGSTGSGKSCAVAKILHGAVGIASNKNLHSGKQRNAHIVVFDVHDEYTAAFTLVKEESFTLNSLGIDSLLLPYWLMNSEELESMFIESDEQNSHNQVSQFKHAVILNKEKHNPGLADITYDAPVFFSLREVCNYIENLNREVIGRLDNENLPKLADGTLVKERKNFYFDKVHTFAQTSTAKDSRATNGPFCGEFNRFVSRLETKLADRRLRFLLEPQKADGQLYETNDFEEIIKQFIGYLNKSNVTIVDLSGIPFEVLSITVSLVSRLILDFCFHYSKLRHMTNQTNDVPVMVVCEEAHNCVPQNDNVAYRASRKSLERVAKEGRKYGLSLMVVSQRPSEVSETIFAQCNNFIALRLTNDADQAYVRLFPDNASGIADILPNLSPGDCIIVGDAVLLPAVVHMPLPEPEPHSRSVRVHSEWKEEWRDITFKDVISRCRTQMICA